MKQLINLVEELDSPPVVPALLEYIESQLVQLGSQAAASADSTDETKKTVADLRARARQIDIDRLLDMGTGPKVTGDHSC